MKTADALKFFKTKAAVADASGVRPQAVGNWLEYPPREAQMRMHKTTAGKLAAEKHVLEFYRDLIEGVL